MPRVLWSLAAASLLASGCSMFQNKETEFRPVSEADFGRLSPAQLGPVRNARELQFAARDDVARAKLRLQQAENEAELARADQATANAARQAAVAEGNVAAKSNAPEAKARAQEAAAQAELQARSVRAHLAYANQLGRARQAELDAAEAMVRVRDAELEQAKLEALSQAKIPAATKYDAGLFAARVAEARRNFLERQAEAKVRLADAEKGENTWRTLHAQYEARVQSQTPAAETATGSGAGQAAGAAGTAAPMQPTPPQAPEKQ